MKLIRTALTLLAVGLFASCGNDQQAELSKLRSEVSALKGELSAITKERDELKFAPSRLLAEAEALAANSKWEEAKNKANELLSKHLGSPDAAKAQTLITKASTAIAAQ